MATIFISDLHLDPANKDSVALFKAFLRERVSADDQLYILGDLFERYVGDDDDDPFLVDIKSRLRAISCPIFIMRGNRDFLLGERFMKAVGAMLLPDEIVVDLYGEQTLLLHGDTLCTVDVAYQRFRRIVHNPVIQALYKALPLSVRKRIADKARQKSREHARNVDLNIMDVSQDAVVTLMKKHGVARMIHGHTHRPAVHEFAMNGESCQRVVLSDWHDKAKIIICKDASELALLEVNQ